MTFRLVPEPPEIGDTDGFSKSDIFEARESGERLANIVGEIEGPSAIVLDGPWGSGKSVFVKQWAGLLRERGHPVVYFDAFEHDHLDDAFFPLLGHLLRAHTARSDGKPALSRFQDKLVGHATALAKATPRILADVALRSATGGILDTSMLRDTQDSANRSTEAKIKECIGSADLMSSCVRSFRKTLADAVSDVGGRDSDGRTFSLVFVIDELDRCRPSYALSILERMKHLFAVDGICFVFVTHLDALASMVRREYGLPEDADYLDKFFQLRFDISSLLFRGSERRRQKYLSHLASSIELEWSSSHYRAIIMNNLVRLHDIPLRSQERIMLNRLLFRATGNQDGGSIHPFGDRDLRHRLADCLCVMREADRSLYRKAARGELGYLDAMGFLRLGEWAETLTGLSHRIDFCWKVTANGGLEHLTDGEKESLHNLDYAGGYEHLLVAVCAHIDQVAQ